MVNNIQFIRAICAHLPRLGNIVGDYIYFPLDNGNRVKAFCENDVGVKLEVINIRNGMNDSVYLPFSNYFQPVCCCPGADSWYQRIDRDKWYFETTYPHLVPKESDYVRLACAIELFISMWEE